MRLSLGAIAIVLLLRAWPQTTAAATSITGTWEGESKCTVTDSPCRDEHVLYRISADKKNPAHLTIDADKVVAGSPQFMGTIVCQYLADQSTLSCTGNTRKQDDWEFHVSGDTMTGTLTIEPGRQLYRRIAVHKTSSKAN